MGNFTVENLLHRLFFPSSLWDENPEDFEVLPSRWRGNSRNAATSGRKTNHGGNRQGAVEAVLWGTNNLSLAFWSCQRAKQPTRKAASPSGCPPRGFECYRIMYGNSVLASLSDSDKRSSFFFQLTLEQSE